jgi:hypothetical protein
MIKYLIILIILHQSMQKKEYNNLQKQKNSLLFVFQNTSLQQTMNSYPILNKFRNLVGFGMLIDDEYSTTKNYLMDERLGEDGLIIEYDENWEYKNHMSFEYPIHLISVNDTIYVICSFQIIKTDRYFNAIKKFTGVQSFVDAFYNSTKNTFFLLSFFLDHQIYEFDLDLNIIDSFYILEDIWSLNGYNQNIYAGGTSGALYIIKDKVISQKIEVYNTRLTSIVFDDYGYMAISTYYNIFLYYSNGTFTNLIMPSNTSYINRIAFDLQGKFIVIKGKETNIFY